MLCAALAITAPASQATTVTLVGRFADGTQATGSFALNVSGYIDESLNALLTRDGTGSLGAFAGFAYSAGQSYASHSPGTGVFEFDRSGGGYSQYDTAFILHLTAPEHLGANSLSLTGSYECGASFSCYLPASSNGNRRFFESGTLYIGVPVPVPEPTTALLLGLPLLLASRLHRRA
jgi:hypothetical protein